MDTPHSDLEAIRQILADLTTRVYRIERRLQMDAAPVESRPSAANETLVSPPTAHPASTPPSPVVPSPPYIPPGESYVVSAQSSIPPRAPYAVRAQSDSDLES